MATSKRHKGDGVSKRLILVRLSVDPKPLISIAASDEYADRVGAGANVIPDIARSIYGAYGDKEVPKMNFKAEINYETKFIDIRAYFSKASDAMLWKLTHGGQS